MRPSYAFEPGCVAPGRTLGSYVRAAAAGFPRQPALEDGGHSINYEEFWRRRSRAVAAGLDRLGVRSGDRVTTIEPNSSAFVALQWPFWEELRGWTCVIGLFRHRIQDDVFTVSDLPRTASGKLQRITSRESAAARRGDPKTGGW